MYDTATSSFISCSTSVFISPDIIFYGFLGFSFFNSFTQTIHPLNSQNLLSVTKVFCRFSLKCLLKYFFKNFLTKFCKSIFYVSAVNCYCTYIFKGSNYRFPGFLFKNSYFDTSISKYL